MQHKSDNTSNFLTVLVASCAKKINDLNTPLLSSSNILVFSVLLCAANIMFMKNRYVFTGAAIILLVTFLSAISQSLSELQNNKNINYAPLFSVMLSFQVILLSIAVFLFDKLPVNSWSILLYLGSSIMNEGCSLSHEKTEQNKVSLAAYGYAFRNLLLVAAVLLPAFSQSIVYLTISLNLVSISNFLATSSAQASRTRNKRAKLDDKN